MSKRGLAGLPLRPMVLFSSIGDLIEMYWSGALQDKTTLLEVGLGHCNRAPVALRKRALLGFCHAVGGTRQLLKVGVLTCFTGGKNQEEPVLLEVGLIPFHD